MWLIKAKIIHLESMLKSYKEQQVVEVEKLNSLSWWKFQDRKFHNEQVYIYVGLINGTELAIKALSNKSIR